MSVHLNDLPLEVLSHTLRCLPHKDLVNVARVSSILHDLTVQLIWTHIELHVPGWHQYRSEYDRTTSEDIGARNYIALPSNDDFSFDRIKEHSVHWRFDVLSKSYRQRVVDFLEVVGSRSVLAGLAVRHRASPFIYVRSICMGITFDTSDGPAKEPLTIWSIFGNFTHLESLELTVAWPHDPSEWDNREQKFLEEHPTTILSELKTLRLRGYVPRKFVRWLLRSPEQLTTLELFVLDRPIGGSLWHPRLNEPPQTVSRWPLEDTEDDGGEIPWVVDDDADSDIGSDYSVQEIIAPRALSILDVSDTLGNLKNISSLTLIRPTDSNKSDTEEDANYDRWSSWNDIYYSASSDMAVLQDWTRLIRATRHSAQHLILDQRPFCDDSHLEGAGAIEFLEFCPYGSGTERFKNIVLPALMEDIEWSALRSISLYGFEVPEPLQTQPHPRVHRVWPSETLENRKSFIPELIRNRFEPLGINVRSELGRRLVFGGESGVVENEEGPGGTMWG